MSIDDRKEILALRKELHATLTVANMSTIHITIKNAALYRLNEIVGHLKELGVTYTVIVSESGYHAALCEK